MIEVLYNKATEENADIVISDMLMEYATQTIYLSDNLSENKHEHFPEIIKNEQSHSFLCNKLIRKSLYNVRIVVFLKFELYEYRHVMSRLFYLAIKL
jgi:hypothetical protein